MEIEIKSPKQLFEEKIRELCQAMADHKDFSEMCGHIKAFMDDEKAKFEYQMLNNTKGGDLVLDSFGGSGTTLIAAEKNGRVARIMELDPKYVDVIVQRYVDYTGNGKIKKNGEEILWQKTEKTSEKPT